MYTCTIGLNRFDKCIIISKQIERVLCNLTLVVYIVNPLNIYISIYILN